MAEPANLKPAELAEHRILQRILSGEYPSGSNLPAERELAVDLEVTRPTLREVLQRLARDGWLDIRHGRSTRIRSFMQDGSLAVLSTLAEKADPLPSELVEQILQIRVLLAPFYTRLAILNAAADVENALKPLSEGSDVPAVLAELDFQVQKQLSTMSGNHILALTMNSMEKLYIRAMTAVYSDEEIRKQARVYIRMVYKAARANEPDAAEAMTRRVMSESLVSGKGGRSEGGRN